jgi:hypothetical protein
MAEQRLSAAQEIQVVLIDRELNKEPAWARRHHLAGRVLPIALEGRGQVTTSRRAICLPRGRRNDILVRGTLFGRVWLEFLRRPFLRLIYVVLCWILFRRKGTRAP